MKKEDDYQFVQEKIQEYKKEFPELREKSNDFVFSVVCVKSIFYRNPNQSTDIKEIIESIVDGKDDGGIDSLFSDPNSDTDDLILCQSKDYQSITKDDVASALHKMADFYSDMQKGQSESYNKKVRERFSRLNGEIGDESKVKFCFFTSAPKNSIRVEKLKEIISNHFKDDPKYEAKIYFLDDIVDQIKEAESMRGDVAFGEIQIEKENCLCYGDDAVIVNVEAYSIKELYDKYNIKLLAQNLRYYVRNKSIDEQIKETIKRDKYNFWYKNNGITIICDDFEMSGPILKLTNFSIINGGQTTTLIGKSEFINKDNSFLLPCKIIKNTKTNKDERSTFVLEIAQATNSQKPIKASDLKANQPEQVRFGNSLKAIGVFYRTKRGEEIPKAYKDKDKNTDLVAVGKLALASIFQLPASSRNKPSSMFDDHYYNPLFTENLDETARCIKDMLYVDNYFRSVFIRKYDKECESDPTNSKVIPFANNSRTICLSYVSLVSRYLKGFISDKDIATIIDSINKDEECKEKVYDIFSKKKTISMIFSDSLDAMNKDDLDKSLYDLLKEFIEISHTAYMNLTHSGADSNESNFLKRDPNYYRIIANNWQFLKRSFESYKSIFVK